MLVVSGSYPCPLVRISTPDRPPDWLRTWPKAATESPPCSADNTVASASTTSPALLSAVSKPPRATSVSLSVRLCSARMAIPFPATICPTLPAPVSVSRTTLPSTA